MPATARRRAEPPKLSQQCLSMLMMPNVMPNNGKWAESFSHLNNLQIYGLFDPIAASIVAEIKSSFCFVLFCCVDCCRAWLGDVVLLCVVFRVAGRIEHF